MTKSDLVKKISIIYPYMQLHNIKRVVDIMIENFTEKLKKGGRVELRGFGTLCVKTRNEIIGRNPKTGEKILIGTKKVPFFKAGKQIKYLINESCQ